MLIIVCKYIALESVAFKRKRLPLAVETGRGTLTVRLAASLSRIPLLRQAQDEA